MSKSARDKIRLVSSAGTGHFYTTDKNKCTMPEKMEIKKYDPVVRKHVEFKEAKIKVSQVIYPGVIISFRDRMQYKTQDEQQALSFYEEESEIRTGPY